MPLPMDSLARQDPMIAGLVRRETERQATNAIFIASATIQSDAVLEALGTRFEGTYGEGYPRARYYNGVGVVDDLEREVQRRANAVFGTRHAMVQALSGSPANRIALSALAKPGETVLGFKLSHGGHLTHGAEVSEVYQTYKVVQYGVEKEGPNKGYIDYDEMHRLAREHKPKVIIAGGTAYSRQIDFERIWNIAQETGAFVMADIAHYAGLVAAEVYPSPVEFAHVVTMTTHKTLGGPRAGLVLVTERGVEADEQLPKKVDFANFPFMNGGPHFAKIAGVGVVLGEAITPEFRQIQAGTLLNAQVVADGLVKRGVEIATGGTDSHMFLVSPNVLTGRTVSDALEMAGIVVSKSTSPDATNAVSPLWFRMGTSVVTRMGMGPTQMEQFATWVANIVEEGATARKRLGYEVNQEQGSGSAKVRVEILEGISSLSHIKGEVRDLCLAHPFRGTLFQ